MQMLHQMCHEAPFTVEQLKVRQRDCWQADTLARKQQIQGVQNNRSISAIRAANYALEQLQENEWLDAAQLTRVLTIFCDRKLEGAKICR